MAAPVGTVSVNQTNLFARGLIELGFQPDSIFESVGLSVRVENDPMARVPVDKIVALGRACEEHTGDAGIGHKLYSRIQLAYLDSLGISLLYSADLMDFLRRFQKFLPYAVSRASVDIFEVETGYYTACNWNLGISDSDQQRITEWFTCAFIAMCEEALGEPFVVDTVLLEFSPSPIMLDILERHSVSVEHSHERYGFVLSYDTVARRLPLANPQMAQGAEELTLQYLSEMEMENLALQVERRIVEGLSTGAFSKEAVAKGIGMSVRSLHTKLRGEGTSYSEILEAVRKNRAIYYIRSDMLHVSQIGYALGFTNPSNFSRAFKAWTGMTPGQYRSFNS